VPPSLTAPEYARTAALMRGRRIKTVGYHPLTGMTDHLLLARGTARVDVTEHPRWSTLVGRTLTGVDICWFADTVDGVRVPAAVRLCSRETVLWIAVGRPEAEGYVLGTDDVLVAFTAAAGLVARAWSMRAPARPGQ
jgi:hypothetical protein